MTTTEGGQICACSAVCGHIEEYYLCVKCTLALHSAAGRCCAVTLTVVSAWGKDAHC